jgi:hypothetical protein
MTGLCAAIATGTTGTPTPAPARWCPTLAVYTGSNVTYCFYLYLCRLLAEGVEMCSQKVATERLKAGFAALYRGAKYP